MKLILLLVLSLNTAVAMAETNVCSVVFGRSYVDIYDGYKKPLKKMLKAKGYKVNANSSVIYGIKVHQVIGPMTNVFGDVSHRLTGYEIELYERGAVIDRKLIGRGEGLVDAIVDILPECPL